MINLFLHLFSITDRYETREICDRAIFEDPFMLAYYPDKYKTQRMCHEAVDVLYADDNILYFNENSSDVILSCNEMGIHSIDLYNLDDTNYDDDVPEIIMKMPLKLLLMSDFCLGILNLKNTKHLKNNQKS